MPECEFCLKAATVGRIVQGYTPQKTSKVIDGASKTYPYLEVYLCSKHHSGGLEAFLPNYQVCFGDSRKL